MHQHCLKTWSRHLTAFNTRKTENLLLQRYPSHLRFVQQRSISSYLRHESCSHTQVSLHLGSHHTVTTSINQSDRDSPVHGKQQNPSDFGWCTAAGGRSPCLTGVHQFHLAGRTRAAMKWEDEETLRLTTRVPASTGSLPVLSTRYKFACFLRKTARSTKTVSAVSPDTDGNKPVTLHGQHPGHQLTALIQSEAGHPDQTCSHKLGPAEQLNSSLHPSRSPPSKSNTGLVYPPPNSPDPVRIPLSHPQSRLSLPPAKTSPVPVRTH